MHDSLDRTLRSGGEVGSVAYLTRVQRVGRILEAVVAEAATLTATKPKTASDFFNTLFIVIQYVLFVDFTKAGGQLRSVGRRAEVLQLRINGTTLSSRMKG